MPIIQIDNQPVEVPPGGTILDGARKLGIEIPTLCHREGHEPLTSCFVCVVRVTGMARLVPSCATRAVEGMVVASETEEVRAARRTALELLLSDHLGDCLGPCQNVCPAHMDIPRMIRHIAAGRLREALITVKERIALPAVLGRICPELCEKGCRRAQQDSPVSICILKRHVADVDLASGEPYLPECRPATGKRVAIVGAGPAGLAAAYYLQQEGIACTLLDEREAPGGMLRYGVPDADLPRDVLDAEIALIARLGARFRTRTRLGVDVSLGELREEYHAVLLAVGPVAKDAATAWGLAMGGHGLKVERHTLAAGLPGLFAAGSAVIPSRHAVRAVGDGRVAARSIATYLSAIIRQNNEEHHPHGGTGKALPGAREFNVRIGRMEAEELAQLAARVSPSGRREPAGDAGFGEEEARAEALRCLHCECCKLTECRLRRHAIAYDASPTEYRAERRRYERQATGSGVVFEPGKCIACGICVQIASEAQEELGLTFIGRGFDVRVGVPFSASLDEGLRRVARECARACPTGALAEEPEG
ncbi:MAG: (2Fe-2S)-binding protein [Armatimonadetes bacterium]|nr:(2Fe-2S)-binding protein [Armatimonadota bacterium]